MDVAKRSNGHANGAEDYTQVSSYLQYLPAPYQGDLFLGRFLMIFESILSPLEGILDTLPYYFDPQTTPEELIPWLASWVSLELDESWTIERRRELIGIVNSRESNDTESFWLSLKRSVRREISRSSPSTTYRLPASAPVTKRDFSRIRLSRRSISRSVVKARAISISSPSS